MSYHVIYEPEKRKKYPVRHKTLTGGYKVSIVLFWIAVFLLLINPVIREPLRNFLIPGDAAVTGKAFETMKQELRAGESVEDAVTAFCQEIMNNEKSTP